MEAMRYLGAGEGDDALRRQLAAVASELTAALEPRYVYRVFDLARENGDILLAGTGVRLTGATASTMLAQCRRAALLACTLGSGFDTLLRKEQARDMGRAVMLDACGSAWVESGCNAAEEELRARLPGLFLTDRFSPGYGDLPFSQQGDFCRILDMSRRIGVSLSPGGLMIPQKSVTALVGIANQPQNRRFRGCAYCSSFETCTYRKEGRTCGSL